MIRFSFVLTMLLGSVIYFAVSEEVQVPVTDVGGLKNESHTGENSTRRNETVTSQPPTLESTTRANGTESSPMTTTTEKAGSESPEELSLSSVFGFLYSYEDEEASSSASEDCSDSSSSSDEDYDFFSWFFK